MPPGKNVKIMKKLIERLDGVVERFGNDKMMIAIYASGIIVILLQLRSIL